MSLTYTGTSNPSLGSATNSTYMVLDNFQSDYYANSNISLFAKFSGQMPTSSRPFTITVTTFYNSGGTTYGIDTLSSSDSCSPGSLSASLALVNSSIGATTSLGITITTSNELYSGSFIGITFPSEISVSGSCSTDNANIACSVGNTSYGNLTISSIISKSTVIVVTFSSIQNPAQAIITSSFQVVSYIDNLFDGIVDQVTSGLTI